MAIIVEAREQARDIAESMRPKLCFPTRPDLRPGDEEIVEAWTITQAVRDFLYPPTNPAVLTRAMLNLYLAYGLWPETKEAIKDIAEWLLYIIE